MTDENSSVADSQSNGNTTEAPQWFIDEKTAGVGARPEWMPAKYQRLSDVEKARSELEKKLGSFTGAPDKYDIAGLELDENSHTLQQLSEVAKEMNMSQEGFAKLLGRFKSASEIEQQMEIEQQVKKLGPDAERQLTEFKNWTKDYLKPEEREVVADWVKTADDLKVFNRMMAHTHMTQVPTMNSMHIANNFESVKDLKAELTKNVDKFGKDASYRKDWSSRMARAVERNPDR